MHDLEGLNRIGIALSETRDVDQLLGLKRAVPADRAIDILKLCERDGGIDSELFRLFLEAQIYRIAEKPD